MDRAALEQVIINAEAVETRAAEACTASTLNLEAAREVARLNRKAPAPASEMLDAARLLLPPESQTSVIPYPACGRPGSHPRDPARPSRHPETRPACRAPRVSNRRPERGLAAGTTTGNPAGHNRCRWSAVP